MVCKLGIRFMVSVEPDKAFGSTYVALESTSNAPFSLWFLKIFVVLNPPVSRLSVVVLP